MTMPKQTGPAQPRRDAGVAEPSKNEESQHNKAERDSDPGRRLKGPPEGAAETPGPGAPAKPPSGRGTI